MFLILERFCDYIFNYKYKQHRYKIQLCNTQEFYAHLHIIIMQLKIYKAGQFARQNVIPNNDSMPFDDFT